MKLQFDPNQEYQHTAIQSVVKAFEGLPISQSDFALGRQDLAAADIVPNFAAEEGDDYNPLMYYEGQLQENLAAIQRENGVQEQIVFDTDEGLPLLGDDVWRYPNYTLEMETGTGKTYVYLRTIYELRRRYGFGKFVIVVPSIAIYEGVVKNFEITRDHFRALYGNETVNLTRYDGSQLSRLRTFAASTFCEIMVMTIDAFNKASNTIYKPTDKLPGELLPYQFLQRTRPILILDEPQNMESDRARKALRTLHPLVALRYSATHKTSPNLLFRLSPFDAYRLNLVKKITVLGVTERENFNQPLLELDRVTTDSGLRAFVTTYVRTGTDVKEAPIALRHGDDLYIKTKRDEHRTGFVVEEISAEVGVTPFVRFTNGITLTADASTAARPVIFRAQIEHTIREHMKRQRRLKERGIKVLSLFFVDRVASYRDDDGIVRRLFDDCFERLKAEFPEWQGKDALDVRRAYFAQKKAGDGFEDVETRDIDEQEKKADERDAEKAAFQLIMRDKEKLLSFEEPVSFIFAHSALKEGWDNPNVFQICTLKQTHSPTRKRQEIGRGLRLCVDQSGARVPGDDVNILLVVANESYKDYAASLQNEYVEDGDIAPPAPSDAARGDAKRNDEIFHSEPFRNLWKKLHRPVQADFDLDIDELVTECANRLNRRIFTKPVLVVERGEFVQTRLVLYLDGLKPPDRASIRIELQDTRNDDEDARIVTVRVDDDLAKRMKDPRLKGFRISGIEGHGDQAAVVFGNGHILTPNGPVETSSEAGQRPVERKTMAPTGRFPIPNLLDRAARETGLTRPTINRIFKAMHPDKAVFLIHNPESFVGAFIAEVSGALADHIAERIKFKTGSGGQGPDGAYLDNLFPMSKPFAQKELRDAGSTCLYDLVQTDSNVEREFVELLKDDSHLVFYFKFPPAFKVGLPRQIGNYNPDWGLGRLSESGDVTIHYVRETKSTEETAELRWTHEKRKIVCAKKYFSALGVDYRPITGRTADWWLPTPAGRSLVAKP